MRIPNKVVCLLSCLTAFTFIHTADAQDYPVQPLGGGYVGNAVMEDETQDPYGDVGYYPLAYQDPGGVVVPDPAAGGYPPPMMQPYPPLPPPGTGYWPNVSPYETPVMDKTYRQNGIWMHEPVFGERTYSFSAEWLWVGFNRPGSDLIGHRDIGVPTNLSASRQVNTTVFADGYDFTSDGVRGKFLIQNSDSSSLELSGFWIGESQAIFHPFGRADPTDTSTLRARGFLGLSDGTEQGVQVPFDTDFELSYKQQAFGGDINYATMPFFETEGFRIRPVFGVKYLKIREQFTLHGEDSGLSYLADQDSGQPIPGTITPNPFGLPAFTSDLTSRTKSDLAGPQGGIRYELGGKNFLLSGQTGMAVLANYEVIELAGNQIGDGFTVGFPQPTPDNPKPAAFRDGRTRTHVSPVFMQDFQFKGKIFKALPVVNDVPFFANADFIVGYNFTLVGNVARPTKVIDWRANDPRIEINQSRWYIQAATFGMQWEF